VRRAAGVCGALLLAGCSSTALSDLPDLAGRPPFPYSVFVTGGAFVRSTVDAQAPPLARTYRGDAAAEAFPLALVADVLERGRVYVRTQLDERPSAVRARTASFGEAGAGEAADAGGREFLDAVRDAGHDFLLVVEELRDGPVEQQGINGQWPVTAATWLMVGLGMLIPDHTYESRAALRVSLREVQTGRTVYEQVLSGGPVDLALLDRTGVLGLVTSIVVPPFWVADDPAKVEAHVREISTRRLLESLARQMKSVDARERVRVSVPVGIEVVPVRGGVRVRVDSSEALSFVRLRRDGDGVPAAAASAFEAELLASARAHDAWLRAEADLPLAGHGRLLQVLVQTVAGRVASVTVELEGR
jgi:hypothetical protein